MISQYELHRIAYTRLDDAEILFREKKYDSAIYLCGYAVELALKKRICKALNWEGYPSSGKEFKNLRSFKTHNLDVLLKLSSVENKILSNYFSEWSKISDWAPEIRYNPIGNVSEQTAKLMICSTKVLMEVLSI
ncbi:HEPN domain-containing protein [Candidatus Magnetomoraceae bacterium gMMP-15]